MRRGIIVTAMGMLFQILVVLCDNAQTRPCCNTYNQHKHPSLLYNSDEDLLACIAKSKNIQNCRLIFFLKLDSSCSMYSNHAKLIAECNPSSRKFPLSLGELSTRSKYGTSTSSQGNLCNIYLCHHPISNFLAYSISCIN